MAKTALTSGIALVAGVSARLTGAQIVDLAEDGDVAAITRDVPMVAAANVTQGTPAEQSWLAATPLDIAASRTRGPPPTIAVVDSGIDAGRRDFGNRGGG